jgi:hypothetical protein
MRTREAGIVGRGLAWAALAAAAGGLAGCGPGGPPIGQVEGRVTFKGKPVTEGTVSFANDAGHGGEAPLDKDGRYVVKNRQGGLPVGDYVVTVTPATYLDSSDPKTPPVVEEKAAPNIPERYRRVGGSPLRGSVKPGKNELDFDMKP